MPRPRRSKRGRGSSSRHELAFKGRFHDLAACQSDDRAEAALENQPAGREAQPGGQDPVVGARRTAALKVAQRDGTCLDPGLLFDRFGDHTADAPEARIAESVGMIAKYQGTLIGELGPFGDDHDAIFLAAGPALGKHADQVRQIDRNLGHEDIVGPNGDPGEAGDPARVTAHRLDDHDPAMAFGRRAQSIDGFRDDVDGRVEAERKFGHHQIVVDGLGNADHRDAKVVMKSNRHAQGIVATNHDQGVELQPGEIVAQERPGRFRGCGMDWSETLPECFPPGR